MIGVREVESANGSMATAATRQEKNDVSQSKNKIALTPTGLLMEGDFTQNPSQDYLVGLRDTSSP